MDAVMSYFRPSSIPGASAALSKRPLTELMQEDEQRVSKLFQTYRCEHVYLDVGTNIGVQIRKVRLSPRLSLARSS